MDLSSNSEHALSASLAGDDVGVGRSEAGPSKMNSAVTEGRTTHDDRLERSEVEQDINDDGMVAVSDDERIERVYDEPDQEAQQYRVTPEEHQLHLQERQQQQFQQQRMMGQESDMDLEDDRPPGKRVKVYELRDQNWLDLGTGFCEGIYDEARDEALLVVIPEDPPPAPVPPIGAGGATVDSSQDRKASGDATGPAGDVTTTTVNAAQGSTTATGNVSSTGEEALQPGGFLREGEDHGPLIDGFLLKSRVTKSELYQRQQETLIVWTEPNGTDVAVSFQDPQGCNDIWDFITEIQRHLQLVYDESQMTVAAGNSSSSPPPMSPPLTAHDLPMAMAQARDGAGLTNLSLSNLKDQETILKLQSRSPIARERTVEFLVHSGYIKQMIEVFDQAEDLESLEDLHVLCSMMQTILALNDNTLYEHLVQDDLFLGVVGILEYDPEFPTLKASYRQFLSESSRFREPIKFDDDGIRAKIHQTYRLLYLRDVVLARVLDDPTFNILNSLLFFNQVDIINYVQGNERLLKAFFSSFRDESTVAKSNPDTDNHKSQVVMLLHQLVLMGKNVQLPNRLGLYRNLVERGLLHVCEWGFRQSDARVLNASTEILSLILDHDVTIVRSHALREKEVRERTLVNECIDLLSGSKDLGIKSQIADALRAMLDVGGDGPEISMMAQKSQKDSPIAEAFVQYFYEKCAESMYQPMLALPDYKSYKASPTSVSNSDIVLLQYLAELLAFFVGHHTLKSQFFILTQPVSVRLASLLYFKHKSLRHAALRYFRACLKTNNHFIIRHLPKQDLILPLIELLETEGPSDNMLSSACLEVFEIIRKDNIKSVINHIFEKYHPRIRALGERPGLRAFMAALTTRWEQNNEPPPPETAVGVEEGQSWAKTAMDEDDYFNASSDEEIGPKPPQPLVAGHKRKRVRSDGATTAGGPPGKKMAPGGLGLDYDDASDSDSSDGASPKATKRSPLLGGSEAGQALAPSPLDLESGGPSPRIKLKVPKASLPEALGEVAMKMSQKRQREEEEEEEGGLAGLMSGGRPGTPRTVKPAMGKDDEPRSAPKSSNALSTAMRETSKKIKLNLGFGKKDPNNKVV